MEDREASRGTMIRFGLKVMLALVFASFGAGPVLIVMSTCLALFAVTAVLFAFLEREPYKGRALTRWDEAMWLVGLSLVLVISHGLMG